ncbi:hypothetical protein OEZ86_008644 [Tetradesmus obliquus]|nr:hypothetical protein OEZ86_008644 [Tetradesmus obliquus]
MQPAAAGGSIYSASLALQGPQLSSLSSSPGVLHFTAVVGTGNRTTCAVARLEPLPGCASGPTDLPPEGGWPWNAAACAASAVGQQCLTYCNWPAYSGSGYYVTCLPDGSWSGPGGFCLPTAALAQRKADGATCKADCDKLLSYTGGYTALCQAGQWTVQSGGGCTVCAAGEAFAPAGTATAQELDPTSANPSATIKSRALGYAGFLGVALDGMGDVLIVKDGPTKHLAHWSDDFTSASNFALLGMPFGIAADRKKGKAYITDQDNGAVVIFDIGGNQVQNATFITGYKQYALKGVAVDAAGNIFLVDSKSGKLMKYDSAGKLLSTWGAPRGSLMSPNGVVVGADGVVRVTEEAGSAYKITCM